jgi:hypothetical protein
VGGKGVLLWTGKKLKISNLVCQSYLRIFPWNFQTDNFPWKYQVLSARQNRNQLKKINCPLQKRKKIKWRSGDFTKKKSLLVNLITFLAYNSTCSRSANIVIST